MSDAKIEIKVGGVEFLTTGNEDWVGSQFDKFLKNVSELSKISPPQNVALVQDGATGSAKNVSGSETSIVAGKSLATFLKDKGATTNQVKKFLTTAIWLHGRGQQRITTADVSKALKDGNQGRLGNPADSLNKNVAKGLCEKDGDAFFVTEEGRNSA